MNRNSQMQALVLSIRRIGEDNRIVKFLTKEKGIFEAVLYGGPKSKLRAYVSPYHFGNLWVYTDETKHSTKITDFEVLKYHPEIRENLYKNWCASFCVELVIKTDCAGDYEGVWKLANGFLDGLSVSTEEECRIALLRFIWRYLGLMGVQWDCKDCVRCGSKLSGDSTYSVADNGFLCKDCFSSSFMEEIDNFGEKFFISGEGVTFLQAITYLSPKEARQVPIHYSTTRQLYDLLTGMITRFSGTYLKTLEMGKSLH